jgi:hypothetical protein
MIRNIALFLALFVPSLTNAQITTQFNFNGQNAEILKTEKKIALLKSEIIQVPSTCYRQVPAGQREVCRNETRYRQECSWIPSSQNCWNDNERVCRSVPRTREECSHGPSQTVCTERPSRRVCSDRPIGEVCRTTRDGRRHCERPQQGPGNCTEVGGGRVCQQVPGPRYCRMVTYSETECVNVPRYRCETIPGRNQCRDIPYSTPVCQMETQYESQAYSCMKSETVTRTIYKTLMLESEVEVATNGLVDEFSALISTSEKDNQYTDFSLSVSLVKEPLVYVVLKNKELQIVSQTNEEIHLRAKVSFEVFNQDQLPTALPASVSKATVFKDSKMLKILFDGNLSNQGSINLKLTHKVFLGGIKTIADVKMDYPSEKVFITREEQKLSLNVNLNDALKRDLKGNMKLDFSIDAKNPLEGKILNSVKPQTYKQFGGISVELK